VVRFLEDVRAERYEQAYATSSPILTGSYTYQQFLMTAGKLQMEELPCVDEEDIEAMELVEGHVGLGPKDVVVSGFRIFYTCEGDDEPRTITVYLDMAPTHLAPPAGVASFFFQ
jgi:hypothetical protein